MQEICSFCLQLSLQLITLHGPWEWGSWNSLSICHHYQISSTVFFALPGTVLEAVKSLFSYPLPFPSLHPRLLPTETEPMQTEPWSRPAACSDCLPRGAAGPHYVAAVSITKKEKFQLSMELRTRKQMLDPTDHSDERQAYPKKLSLNSKTFSVATKVMLKCWDAVTDRSLGCNCWKKRTCLTHALLTQLPSAMQLAVSYLFRYCNTLPDGCVLTSIQAHSHLLMWEVTGNAAFVWCTFG